MQICASLPRQTRQFSLSLKLVGVHGLDAITLDQKWSRELSDSDGSLVDVVCAGIHVYAGCNGYVFCLDAFNGNPIRDPKPLKDFGNHETRLAISLSPHPTLLV